MVVRAVMSNVETEQAVMACIEVVVFVGDDDDDDDNDDNDLVLLIQ
jgi:hypothetical protein